MIADFAYICIGPDSTIREAVACIDRNEKGIVLVTDKERRLLNTVTDGDIRRAIMAGIALDEPVRVILERKANSPYPVPVSAPAGTDRVAVIRLMKERVVRQVPLLDDEGRVVDLVTLDDCLPRETPAIQAMVMAGGLGRRLTPLTEEVPKPMLPVGDRPLLEHIINQLRESGIQRINITTHYKSEKIREHFGDGHDFGVEIQYVSEGRPLGTAGAVGLIEPLEEPLLVINGDILTSVDYRAMLTYHQEHNADMTVAVRKYDFQVPFGILECEGSRVLSVHEKPTYGFFVNAGIYMLQPDVHSLIPNGQHLDMTELIDRLIAEGRHVVSFPILEYWLDIGEHTDYERAKKDFTEGKLKR